MREGGNFTTTNVKSNQRRLPWAREQFSRKNFLKAAATRDVQMPENGFGNCPAQLAMKRKTLTLTTSDAMPRFATKSHPPITDSVFDHGKIG